MDNNPFEIEKVFIASTAHFNGSNELDMLSYGDFIIDQYEYGIRLKISGVDFPNVDRLSGLGYSKGFCQIVCIAKDLDCDWIRFDSDGLIYEEAQSYNW